MSWRTVLGDGSGLLGVFVKALLLYLTAIVGLRVSHRRTLAEMTGFDFVAAVAVGAIVGRVPNADGTTYLAGLVTLVTVLAAHAVLARARRRPLVARFLDHPPRLLVSDGRVLDDALRACGLTVADLHAQLREKGVYDLSDVRYVIFEQRGSLSVVRCQDADERGGQVLSEALANVHPDAGLERYAERPGA